MATRSGKPYNHETKTPRKRQLSTKDSTIDKINISHEQEEINLNISNMSNRELRAKKPKKKDLDAGQATQSTWIVSDVSTKKKKKATCVKTVDGNNISISKETIAKDIENDINATNVGSKQFRRRRSNADNCIIDKTSKKLDSNFEKDEEITTDVIDEPVMNTESNDDSAKQLKKKKKKVKGGKKKKLKGKISKEAGDENQENVVDNTSEKESINIDKVKNSDVGSTDAKKKQLRSKKKAAKDAITEVQINTTYEKDDNKDKSTRSATPNISIEKNVSLNSSVSKKQLRSKKSVVQDTTFKKEDAIMDNIDTKVDKKRKNSEKNVIEKDLDIKSPDISNRKSKRSSVVNNTTFEKEPTIETSIVVKNNSAINDLDPNVSNISNKKLKSRKSVVKDTTFDKDTLIDTTNGKDDKKDQTFDKEQESDTSSNKSNENKTVNLTFDKTNYSSDKNGSTSFDSFRKGANTRKSSIRDSTFDKSDSSFRSLTKEELEKDNNILSSSSSKRKSLRRQTIDIGTEAQKFESMFENSEPKRKSIRMSAAMEHVLNTTFEKETVENCKDSKSSLISSDNSVYDKSEISRISITSDDTTEDIVNTTPVLIESSVDETQLKESPDIAKEPPNPQTPLKREGTFTKDVPETVPQSPQTPDRRVSSVTPAAGCTPYHAGKSSQKKPLLNVTRSIEKRLSVELAPRLTRVMFCSPVDNPAAMTQDKRKVIKSNLKGSNKSFVFDESASIARPARKRSYTHNDVDDSRAKRSRLADDLKQSVDRLSRPRTGTTTAKINETTPKKQPTLFKSKSETKSDSKSVRTRLPNFAALHQKQFDKMESLDECQERKAKRAKQMLTPNGALNMLERISPKNAEIQKPTTKESKPKDKTDTPSKKKITIESLRPGFTRFGFKLNLDINPFSVPSKTDKKEKPNGIVPKQGPLPSLTGATSVRREVAKQTVMREKSFLEKKRYMSRNENRTIIKGVRTNRRFELQMKHRNMD